MAAEEPGRHREPPGAGGRFAGRVAVVTGAAAGIGRATAFALAREGAITVLVDIDGDGARAVCQEIVTAGGTAEALKADVADATETQAIARMAEDRWDRLDILVNNAGVSVPGRADEVSEEDWQRALAINLTGVWRGMRAALPLMVERGKGAIVNVASVQGLIGVAGWAAYAASKGGVLALTRQAAVDFAPSGIRINAVAPGTILTPMNRRILEASDSSERLMGVWRNAHPMGRVGDPGEVADAICFLASDEACFITGECLRVDGGLVIASKAGGLE